MPEAPEVQTVLNYLEKELKDKEIASVSITHPKLADNMSVEDFQKDLKNQHFRRFFRRGKYLVFEMDDYDLVAHMRMEGKFIVCDKLPEEEKIKKHIHGIFSLSDGKILYYQDTRKFGRMALFDKKENLSDLEIFKKVGLDVLDPGCTKEYLYNKIKNRKVPIKTALLNQQILAGLGNIYADEVLFEAKIDPRSVCSHLDEKDCENIIQAAKAIIKEAIKNKGTTIRSFSSGNHEPGTFQEYLKVHQRNNETCKNCENEIICIKINNRSTYLCPQCQKLK